MRVSTRRAAVSAALALSLMLTACGGQTAMPELEEPASKEAIEGTDLYTVYLTESAAERLDINTAEVASSDQGMTVPSAALILDPQGRYWVYVSDQPLAYYRAEISPVREADGWAYYTDGPGPGTTVVVEGVPELYGEETGVGK